MNEETLILYYYDDGLSNSERREVQAALDADPGLAARYERLCTELDGMADAESPAVPQHVVHRWHDAIESAARQASRNSRPPRSFSPLSFLWGAAVTAALAVGIGIGVMLDVEDTVPVTGPDVSGAFSRGVAVYLRDTRQELSAMPVHLPADRTTLILDIIEQNRLYELAAEQNNSSDVARVLRAFEPILLRLAAEDIAPEDAEALRAQLAFELEVMLTKLSRDSSNEQQST